MARVAKPAGRVLLSTHESPARSAFLGMAVQAVQEAGAQPPDLPEGPPMFHYAEDAVLASLLTSAGLEPLDVHALSLRERTTVEGLWDTIVGGSVRTAALIAYQPEDVQQEIRAIFKRKAADFAVDGGIEEPFVVKVAVGRRIE